MPITINGSGTVTGISAGGLPDGSITPADLSTGGPTWDSSGRLLVGTSTSIGGEAIQSHNTGGDNLGVGRFAASAGSGDIAFYKSRSGTVGTNTVVNAQDSLGLLSWKGADGASYIRAATIEAYVDGTPGSNDMPGRLVFSTTADGASSPTERMRINASGEVAIQTLLTLRYLGISTGFLGYDPGAGGATQGIVSVVCRGNDGSGSGAIGVALTRSATSWSTYSDERLKTNLQDIEDGLNKIASLRSVTGRYKTDDQSASRSFLIAQDVQAVLPEAVSQGDDEDATLSLRYTEVIPLLVAALKESKERIETLEASNADLLSRVAALEATP